jgi:Tetratricopeptide repeat
LPGGRTLISSRRSASAEKALAPKSRRVAYLRQGRNAEAIQEFQKAVDLSSSGDRRPLRDLGYAYGISGKRAQALAILKQVQEKYERQEAAAQDVAAVYAGLGQKDEAFAWLEKAFDTACCRRSDGNHPSSHCAATPATPTFCAAWDFSHERSQLKSAIHSELPARSFRTSAFYPGSCRLVEICRQALSLICGMSCRIDRSYGRQRSSEENPYSQNMRVIKSPISVPVSLSSAIHAAKFR